MIRAVLWDLGGVILTSPFDAFARFEAERALPHGFLRMVNATNPDDNAWARLERSELSEEAFEAAFAAESSALGHEVSGRDVIALLAGEVRQEMVAALDAVRAAGFTTACLTNNVSTAHVRTEIDAVMRRFDVVIESSKVGVRKPERRFYEIACEKLAVTPAECAYLDDLGINLKPAKAMGMRTIKVADAAAAIAELESVLGVTMAAAGAAGISAPTGPRTSPP